MCDVWINGNILVYSSDIHSFLPATETLTYRLVSSDSFEWPYAYSRSFFDVHKNQFVLLPPLWIPDSKILLYSAYVLSFYCNWLFQPSWTKLISDNNFSTGTTTGVTKQYSSTFWIFFRCSVSFHWWFFQSVIPVLMRYFLSLFFISNEVLGSFFLFVSCFTWPAMFIDLSVSAFQLPSFSLTCLFYCSFCCSYFPTFPFFANVAYFFSGWGICG